MPIPSAVSSILIAENDHHARSLLAGWLGEAGHVCATATTADALTEARAHSPEAVLVSVTSLDDGGMWILRTLNGQADRAATVALTANAGMDVVGEARRLGAVECLPWPSSRVNVVESVQRALDWRTTTADTVQRWKRLVEHVANGREQLKETIARVEPNAVQTVVLAALEARAVEISEHAQRVARTSAALAGALRLPPAEVRTVRTAALLHDTGKLALPDALLRSPGLLSDEEIAIIRSHVTIASEVLGAVPALVPAARLVAAAHERFDGLGYPSGAAGVQIPLGARVIAVADAYDALIAERTYADPMTHDDANAQLVRDAGTRFDPDIVRTWVEMGDHARCC